MHVEEVISRLDGVAYVVDSPMIRPALTFAQWLINRGQLFYAVQRVTASAAVRSQLIRVQSKHLHLSITFKSGLATPVSFLEGVNVTANGVALVRRNYNRTFADDLTEALFFTSPTTNGGTEIRPNQAGFGTNPGQALSGEMTSTVTYVLKPNTNYLLSQAPSGVTDTVIIFDFYESEA